MQRLWVGVACVVAAGCQTGGQDLARREERLSSFKGATLANFIQVTGVAPSDYFETERFRVFIVHKQLCTLHVYTRRANDAARADSWQIVSIDPKAPCGNI